LLEGLVDHHLLALHHVRDLPIHVPFYDWLFLGIGGVGFMLLGWALAGGLPFSCAPSLSSLAADR
jgi:uncharacterized membrane protein